MANQPEKLGALLRQARAKVSPERFDLPRPADPRGQHADGLRQSDMDGLMGATPETYARLERGRIRRPSRELLECVGRVLELTGTEWRELWAYALGQEPPGPFDPHADAHIPQVWRDHATADLDRDGYPVMTYLISGDWTLVEHNTAFARLFPSGWPPANICRWMLLDDEARDRVLMDWERSWAPAVMSQLRIAHETRPWQQGLTQIVHDVLADEVAGPIYRRDPRAEMHPDGDIRPLHHPDHGPGYAHIGASGLVGASGARFMVVQFKPRTEGKRA
jgi:hypothetical protein